MRDKSDSSLARMLAVLDHFSEHRNHLSPEDVSAELGVSLPTAYRYLKTLSDAGLLRRSSESSYTLGPRIVMLDHLIRQNDPVLQCALPHMQQLVSDTGLDCVLSALHGDQLLDTHREFSAAPAHLSYGRGRPRPLFQGAAPKVILSALPATRLRRLIERHMAEVIAAGLPATWPDLRRYFQRIKKDGCYSSMGELEPNLAALAVPLATARGDVVAALSLVTTVPRMAVFEREALKRLLQHAARNIGTRLA